MLFFGRRERRAGSGNNGHKPNGNRYDDFRGHGRFSLYTGHKAAPPHIRSIQGVVPVALTSYGTLVNLVTVEDRSSQGFIPAWRIAENRSRLHVTSSLDEIGRPRDQPGAGFVLHLRFASGRVLPLLVPIAATPSPGEHSVPP
jgi:hypothetical protein